MYDLEIFQGFDADRLSLAELVVMAAFGRTLRAEFKELQIDEPEFVGVQLAKLRREIGSKVADQRAARRKQLTQKRDALKTPTEKREEIEAELRKLDAIEQVV